MRPSLSRLAIAHAKRALRLSTRSDRVFLTRVLMHALETGAIGKHFLVAADGKKDGAGAQILAKMSAICFARAYGLTYAHVPFRTMAHAEAPMPEWLDAWEKVVNLGHGEVQADDVELPRVGIEDFALDKSLRRKPCVVVSRHFNLFTDLNPGAYLSVAPLLRAKYQLNRSARPSTGQLKVAVHVRRGDVDRKDRRTGHRFAKMPSIVNTVRQVQIALAKDGVSNQITVFSQGEDRDFSELSDHGCQLRLNSPALEAFEDLVAADILVMGKSAFSYAAAILSTGVKFYDRFDRPPLPGWIERDASGGFEVSSWPTATGR
ncbi:MAG: hypothetical protein ACT4OU_10030 [Hyphomicrobium sp.]